MSHTVNIRTRYKPGSTQKPQKRQRLESLNHQVNGHIPTTNGIPNHANLSAKAVPNVKQHSNAQTAESTAKIRSPDAAEDSEMADSGPEVNGVDSDIEEDDEEDEDDDEDEDEHDDRENGGVEVDGVSSEEHAEADDQEAEAEDSNEESEVDAAEASTAQEKIPKRRLVEPVDTEMQDTPKEEPSFGDMIKARGQDTVDVDALYTESHPEAKDLMPTPHNRSLTVPTANSLGTVLTQALRTNDVDLMESCFQITNLESIRATIERLHSSHATTLLQKLAERLHRRPGRAGSLMVWVQWTVVAHGGYLASQPAAMRELHTLHQVVKQRATGLQPLLALKGKLDLLEAQMQLRRNVQARSAARHPNAEQGVTYVEGEESSSEDEAPPAMGPTSTISTKPRSGSNRIRPRNRKPRSALNAEFAPEEGDEDIDIEEDMPNALPNGIDAGDIEEYDEDSDASDDDDDDLIDDEAEETDEDSEALSDEVDFDDMDEVPDSEDDDRPAKRSRAA